MRRMSRLILISLSVVAAAGGTPALSEESADLIGPDDGQTKLTIKADGTCKVEHSSLRCGSSSDKRCKKGVKVWWNVENLNIAKADIALVDFNVTIDSNTYYVDPLRSPNSEGGMHRTMVDAHDGTDPGKETIKTKVRKLTQPFANQWYKYKIAVSFDPFSTWSFCPDPMIDIGN